MTTANSNETPVSCYRQLNESSREVRLGWENPMPLTPLLPGMSIKQGRLGGRTEAVVEAIKNHPSVYNIDPSTVNNEAFSRSIVPHSCTEFGFDLINVKKSTNEI